MERGFNRAFTVFLQILHRLQRVSSLNLKLLRGLVRAQSCRLVRIVAAL